MLSYILSNFDGLLSQECVISFVKSMFSLLMNWNTELNNVGNKLCSGLPLERKLRCVAVRAICCSLGTAEWRWKVKDDYDMLTDIVTRIASIDCFIIHGSTFLWFSIFKLFSKRKQNVFTFRRLQAMFYIFVYYNTLPKCTFNNRFHSFYLSINWLIFYLCSKMSENAKIFR